MQEPGLDRRHRNKNGQIDLKKGNTLNKNLPGGPIPQFSPLAKLSTMRAETGQESIAKVREAAKKRK